MGMPACTITSQTAHGGVVTVGFPTVLIGEFPASRIGDLHVCPMTTGPVPHVGGPFILGSPTVLVGNMPQSRVTDQLTCVGPPDVAIKGCETVLVGMAGAGGAAGAAGGAAAMGVPIPMQPTSTSSSTTQCEMLGDGTLRTSSSVGRLPPITLQQKGWPDLPAKQTRNFQEAQPVTLPEGTPLCRVFDGVKAVQDGGYWALSLPEDEESWRSQSAVSKDFNDDGHVTVVQAPAGGLKCWMGRAAGLGELGGGGTQVYVPPGTLSGGPVYPSPWNKKGGK